MTEKQESDCPIFEAAKERLRRCIRAAAKPGCPVSATAVPGLTAVVRETAGSCECSVYKPCIVAVAMGGKQAVIGEKAYDYGAGDVFVSAMDVPVIWRVTKASQDAPFMAASLELDAELVRELLPRLPAAVPSDEVPSVATIGACCPEMLDAFSRMLSLGEHPEDIPVLYPLIKREIHWRVLTGPWGESLKRLFTADSQTNRIERAVAWLRDNFKEPLSVDELADRVHMAPSTFYRHFKTVMNLSPLQYHKLLRLHEARRLMIVKQMDAATAAYSVGYVSPTQFSREYKRLFGASPKKSVAAMRS